jgi:single-stranded DNA-binding protein
MVDRALVNLHKGTKALFEGKMVTRNWTDQEGNTRTTEELIAHNFHLLATRQSAQ